MKFLKDEEITRETEDGKISITLLQLSTSMQGTVLSMSSDQSIDGQIKTVKYILLNHISKVTINGKSYPPEDVANRSNLADEDTLKTVIKILGLSLDAIVLTEADRKKPSGQGLQKEKEKVAESAHLASKKGHQSSVQ